MADVIAVKDLRKTYRAILGRGRIEALTDVSFTVGAGEVFGFLGPNGAGKTTTIRILMGLISATSGCARIFGREVPHRASRARLGFLPESPYFHEYLSVAEMLDLAGRLFGMDRRQRRRRAGELIERVGLAHARDIPLKKYSRGMLQRAGIAQALINDPELVVLDEPMSGLDPLGRNLVRDVIESLRDHGKTVFFSSHILADVELMSDRVGIVVGGAMRDVGTLSELIHARLQGTEIGLRLPQDLGDEALAVLTGPAERVRRRDRDIALTMGAEVDIDDYLARARELGARLLSVIPRHDTLEDLFLRHARPSGKTSEIGGAVGSEVGDGPEQETEAQEGTP
jgi:ABC-2 type transport system ATP-binding protein